MSRLSDIRLQLSQARFLDETEAVRRLLSEGMLSSDRRMRIERKAAELVRRIRGESQPGLMEQFLAEYGLSTREGVALMCLAEAYLRTPDALSLDALIRDKIGAGDWGSHMGSDGSFLVNASTWALMLTGRMFKEPAPGDQLLSDVMLQAIGRMGETLTQNAIRQAMQILGRQFVLGREIDEALAISAKNENSGYRYSFDMLGEAARTSGDAEKYFHDYFRAIDRISRHATETELHARPGVSVKLSALHPRYEQVQRTRVMQQLVPKVRTLAIEASKANIGFTIDAEEADRLELTLDVIEAVLSSRELAGWDGFGAVVQSYLKQAPAVIEWLETLAGKLGRKITVRLVKGAYWDYEIKHAQLLGLENYPVYTRKTVTDVSFLNCARQLLDGSAAIYPQFATHNAHSACAILEMARSGQAFEFQRLHGMGEALHRLLMEENGTPCRVYAPVGVHKDLLAYLVRRLLENGTNSSFVHQLLDEDTPAEALVADPVRTMETLTEIPNRRIPLPPNLYGEQRINSGGINLNLPLQQRTLDQQLREYQQKRWRAEPIIPDYQEPGRSRPLFSPADSRHKVGEVVDTGAAGVRLALKNAVDAFDRWSATPVQERADLLDRIADLYQQNRAELIALAILEAGKTRQDGILEIREAIDFCRYYAAEARDGLSDGSAGSIGPVVCISPWNFPLAIFTGQVAAALVCGNTVLAKPAEQSTLTAARAVELMHKAGVPKKVLQFLPGEGATVGQALTASDAVKAVCFTGSMQTAELIDRTLSIHGHPDCRLVAETGGLNSMIVDSTALLEQVVRDVISSAFQSAGQRCSALRILCVQQEIEAPLLDMLQGAARELVIGDPWQVATDVGPVIDEDALRTIKRHCDLMTEKGRLLFNVPLPDGLPNGNFVSPVAFRLKDLQELEQEIFGPVLHLLSYQAEHLDELVDQINATGYGLTMGVHSRIDTRVKRICSAARVGNIYVNRNQIGAVVGVQPFGGQGLSGTGPKAGGPNYLEAFVKRPEHPIHGEEIRGTEEYSDNDWEKLFFEKLEAAADPLSAQYLWDSCDHQGSLLGRVIEALPESQAAIADTACRMEKATLRKPVELPGPTGERNLLSLHGRGSLLCLGGGANHEQALITQVFRALMAGNLAVVNATESDALVIVLKSAFQQAGLYDRIFRVESEETEKLLAGIHCSAVMFDGEEQIRRSYRQLLAARPGERVALLSSASASERLKTEKVVTTDTTASGGNAALLALDEG